MRISTFAWFSVVVLLTGTLDVSAKQRLLIGSIVKKINDTSDFGIKLALETAKNSPQLQTFMNEFDVEIEWKAASGDENLAISWVAYWLQSPEQPLLLLGPEDLNLKAVMGLIHIYREIMVTYLAIMPPALNYKLAVTLASTSSSYNKAKNKMMEHFGWKRAGILYDMGDNSGAFTKVVFDLAKTATFDIIGVEAINTDVYLIETSLDDDTQARLRKLKEGDTKIFFGEFGRRGASLVFCESFKLRLFGPGYVWIVNREAGTVDDWVKYAMKIKKIQNNTEMCSRENYKEVSDGIFFFDKYDFRADIDTPTDSGMTVTQLFNRPNLQDIEERRKVEVTSAFDAAWTVFLAMKNASVALRRYNISLNDTSPRTKKELINNEILEAINTLRFEGLTGPVSFNHKGEREGVLVLKQMRDSGSSIVRVGQHLEEDNIFQLYNRSKNSLFKDNRIPRDSSLKVNQMVDVSPSLFIVFSVASCIGIVLGVIFLVFNQYYRKYKFIRLSAPLFNDIIVLGCIFCLSTVILFGLRDVADPDITMSRICKARAWILTIGFSMAFGAMFVKTWRIYKICTNKRLKVRLGPLSDSWMLAMVGGIVLIDVMLLTTWEIVDPLTRDTYTFAPKTLLEHPDKPYVIVIPTINTCTAKNLTLWLTLIYVYKGILLLYGLFLSYETRNVVYAHLNDSRVIGICVYNVVVLSTIGAFLALILTDSQHEQLYAALSVCITFPATATISLIFIPKVIHRMKANSLDGETTMDQTWRPSIDDKSVYGFQTEIKRETFVDHPSNSNTLHVYENGDPTVSSSHIPPPPVTVNDNPAMVLED